MEEASVLVDSVAAFVHGPVMAAAEENQVRERRLPAASPVADVMSVDEPVVLAAGEAAAAVART